ncbi:MAG: hypothetical protein WBA57_11645 [Elainellaceae cyanobacterium]
MVESESNGWYIIQQETGHCDIVTISSAAESPSEVDESSPYSKPSESSGETETLQMWGPFDSQGEAIARRVGLIRSGRCKPV